MNFVENTGARLTMLNVIEDPASRYPASIAFVVPQNERDELLAASTRFLQREAHNAFPALQVESICRMGDPAKEIIRFVAENQIDLIMMPTAGCGPFRTLLLGSVTAKVLDDAKCAVWTDAHTEHAGRPAPSMSNTVLCAIDEQEESIAIIRAASEVAATFGASLTLLHAVPEIDVRVRMLRPELVEESLDSATINLESLRDKAGVNAEVTLREGAVSIAVREAALGCGANLVVIGRGHVQRFLGRLRTNAYAVIRDSPCPVLSV
jgi:nucleotide-binding universal stress UspA family protein